MENNRDIVILCSPRLVEAIAEAFRTQFEAEVCEASVIWAGTSLRYRQGVIVLEWAGEVPADFLNQLEREPDFIDYMLYEVPTIEVDNQDIEVIASAKRTDG